jgi:predicted phage terminase large subunit-like protein
MASWKTNPLPWHKEFIRNRKRFNHLRYGRRAAKTSLFADLILESASKSHKMALALPTAKDFEKRWIDFERYYHKVLKESRISDQVMIFTTKAQLDWYGIYRIDGMRGNKYNRVLVDEAAHADGLIYAWDGVIRPTLMDYKGDAYFGSTPNGMNDFYILEMDRAAKSPNEWYCQHGTTYDNPFIDPAEIDALKLSMSSIMFQQEILAEYIDTQGARVKREWLRYGDAAPAGLPIYVGVDLAISQREEADYTAIVVTAHDPDGTIYVIDAVRARATFHETMGLIKSVAAKHQPNMIAVENVGYQQSVIQELVRTTTLPVSPINVTKDKISRFFPVEGKIEHGHVVLLRTLDTAFESELLSFPQGEHDDYVDAFVHSVNAAQNQVSITWL